MKLFQTLVVFSILIASPAFATMNPHPTTTDTQLIKGLPDFTPLIDKYSSAVVNIIITMKKDSDESASFYNPFSIPPENPPSSKPPSKTPTPPKTPPPLKKDGSKPEDKFAHGEGSGCIITSDGYILTNAHVVDEAISVVVHLTNQREYTAKVIGYDHFSDIAVIKIDATNLPTVVIGDSSKMRPGQWVVAIGSPFGFEGTVTSGIISAIARPTRDSVIPFIQTDVPINPGNSGGPLFNMNGEVIGINSEIYTHSGSFEGISFAIPINIAVDVEQQLIKTGRVVHGRIGIMIENVDQQIANDAGLDRPHGAFVGGVQPGGPAFLAGLKEHDIILSINGIQIERSAQLPILVSSLKPNSIAKLEIIRNKQTIVLPVTIAELSESARKLPVQEKH